MYNFLEHTHSVQQLDRLQSRGVFEGMELSGVVFRVAEEYFNGRNEVDLAREIQDFCIETFDWGFLRTEENPLWNTRLFYLSPAFGGGKGKYQTRPDIIGLGTIGNKSYGIPFSRVDFSTGGIHIRLLCPTDTQHPQTPYEKLNNKEKG